MNPCSIIPGKGVCLELAIHNLNPKVNQEPGATGRQTAQSLNGKSGDGQVVPSMKKRVNFKSKWRKRFADRYKDFTCPSNSKLHSFLKRKSCRLHLIHAINLVLVRYIFRAKDGKVILAEKFDVFYVPAEEINLFEKYRMDALLWELSALPDGVSRTRSGWE